MLPLTKIIAIPKIHLGMLVNSETASTTNFFNDEYALSAITNYTLGSLDAVSEFTSIPKWILGMAMIFVRGSIKEKAGIDIEDL